MYLCVKRALRSKTAYCAIICHERMKVRSEHVRRDIKLQYIFYFRLYYTSIPLVHDTLGITLYGFLIKKMLIERDDQFAFVRIFNTHIDCIQNFISSPLKIIYEYVIQKHGWFSFILFFINPGWTA